MQPRVYSHLLNDLGATKSCEAYLGEIIMEWMRKIIQCLSVSAYNFRMRLSIIGIHAIIIIIWVVKI